MYSSFSKKCKLEGLEFPSHIQQARPPQPLIFPEILEGLVALWSPAPISCCHQILYLCVACCLLPLACSFPIKTWCLTWPANRTPVVKSYVCFPVQGLKQVGGCSIKAINVWPDGGGCNSRLELAYILAGGPDSHCNHAKPLITGTLWSSAVPRALLHLILKGISRGEFEEVV